MTGLKQLVQRLEARNTLVATAGRDTNSASTTVATTNAVTSGTNINQNASISVSEPGGTLTAVAGRDINLKASGTSADNVTLVAQRDVNLSTVHETSQEKITWDGGNRAEVNRDNAIGSTVQGKNIGITGGRDINSQAAYVCNDPAKPAHLDQLKKTPQPVPSSTPLTHSNNTCTGCRSARSDNLLTWLRQEYPVASNSSPPASSLRSHDCA